jgi:uncharacterized iron-regulated membrane protein
MKLRSVLFWTHLTAGVIAGTVILIMSATGVLLTFQQSVLNIVEGPQRSVAAPAGAARLDADVLLSRVRAAVPGAQPSTITIESDPTASVMVALGTQGLVFVNPYTGEVLGTGSAKARAFYRTITSWHRYLGAEGERRPAGRAITGACNAAFLVLALTGLVLWWPRQLTWKHVSAVTFFRRGLRGKARDFNWHNTIGFWCAPVLIVLTATGMVISYTWAGNLVYTLTGSPRPAAAARGGAAGGGDVGRAGARAERAGETGGRGDVAPARAGAPLAAMVARAEQQVPTWRTMIVRLPPRPAGPVSVSISDRNYWNSFARSTLTLDGATGDTVRWEPYAATSRGQKMRGWMRFAHTGELGGLTGELVAGAASVGGTFLVWTGIALSLRRLAAWLGRRRTASAETPEARVA